MPGRKQTATGPRLAYRPAEAAAVLGLGYRTVKAYIASGDLHVHRVGRAVLVTRDDIEDFLSRHRSAP